MKKIEHAIVATQAWLTDIVVGLNFCPFAKKPLVQDRINYVVSEAADISLALAELNVCCQQLQQLNEIDTTLLIFYQGFESFEAYLDLVDAGNELISRFGYEGEFQLASFHPNYCFADAEQSDPANFTNRSPYPMLHIIREADMARVLAQYPDPESIPETNITVARNKGALFFQQWLQSISMEK